MDLIIVLYNTRLCTESSKLRAINQFVIQFILECINIHIRLKLFGFFLDYLNRGSILASLSIFLGEWLIYQA